jgi:DNA helicase-2/ATP-dependent DNA helicase PcrA
MQWSSYSEAIFDTWQSTESNILVQAAPGSGKTTNISHLWQLDDKPTAYVVFNKSNQLEAERKLPPKGGSAVLTTHSLGYRALQNTFGSVKMDEKKVIKLVRQLVSPRLKRLTLPKGQTLSDLEWSLVKAVNTAKFHCMDSVCTDADYTSMVSTFDLATYDDMQDDITTVLEVNDDMVESVDFGDMLRLPVFHAVNMPAYEHVLCDEVQDFNMMQALLVAKLDSKKYCFVGDAHQSIYGFRGAMLESMAYLGDVFHCTELPLSISYRCPQTVVHEAAAIWPTIEPWEQAIVGEVQRYASHDSRVTDQLMQTSDAKEVLVLCRNNAPLISYAYALLKAGVACYVVGKADIARALVRLIDSFPVQTVRELLVCLDTWMQQEVEKAARAEDTAQRDRVQDKYASLVVLCGAVQLDASPLEVKAHIERLFEEGRGVALSTVHKAKGLEAQRVYLLGAELFMAARSRARTAWQAEQEKNVQFVAVTRAQRCLTYC